MTWTYGGDPSANARDQVRWLIHDTNPKLELVQDEEIAFALTQEQNEYMAAAEVLGHISITPGLFQSFPEGTTLNMIASGLDKRAKALKLRGSGHQRMFAGGISKAENCIPKDDPDQVQPSFTRDLHENKGS